MREHQGHENTADILILNGLYTHLNLGVSCRYMWVK